MFSRLVHNGDFWTHVIILLLMIAGLIYAYTDGKNRVGILTFGLMSLFVAGTMVAKVYLGDWKV